NFYKNYNPKIMSQRASSACPGYTFFQSKQSPKSQSGKFRNTEYKGDKLFSLLDIPVSKVARSIKMPVQYLRPEEKKQTVSTIEPEVCNSARETRPIQEPLYKMTERNIKTANSTVKSLHNEKV